MTFGRFEFFGVWKFFLRSRSEAKCTNCYKVIKWAGGSTSGLNFLSFLAAPFVQGSPQWIDPHRRFGNVLCLTQPTDSRET